LAFVLPPRSEKPRDRGKTAVIDFGPDTLGWTGPRGVADLLECAAPYIDYAKIYAMNSLLMPEDTVRRIVSTYRDAEVECYSGGILFEHAWRSNEVDAFRGLLDRVGLRAMEVSENYITLTDDQRLRLIDGFRKDGLSVIYEFGRKNPEQPFDPVELERIVRDATEAGAVHVIIEQSELDAVRAADPTALDSLADCDWFRDVWIEADPFAFPRQHVALIDTFGPEVNLANVSAGQALRLEGLRRGIGRAVDYRMFPGENG